MKNVLTIALGLFIGLQSTAQAAERPADCAALTDSQQRLSCFDGFFPLSDVEAANDEIAGPIENRYRQEMQSERNWFSLTPHKPNYFLPFSHNLSPDYSAYPYLGQFFKDTEAKFQLSLKSQVWPGLWRDSSLWIAYTQVSYWQLYADDEASAPFRETNHQPEVMWRIPVDFKLFGMNARVASFAFNHQSNGQSDPLSRSWNRFTGELVLERGRYAVSAKSWVRIDDPENDNNPNIEDYMGRIQLGGAWRGDKHEFALGLKNNLSSDNRSGVEFNWTFPVAQHLRGFVQLYSGYGENMIDMEQYTNRIGIGIALTDWL